MEKENKTEEDFHKEFIGEGLRKDTILIQISYIRVKKY